MSDDYWSSLDAVYNMALVGKKARMSAMYARH
jgi:hypothetical protein